MDTNAWIGIVHVRDGGGIVQMPMTRAWGFVVHDGYFYKRYAHTESGHKAFYSYDGEPDLRGLVEVARAKGDGQ